MGVFVCFFKAPNGKQDKAARGNRMVYFGGNGVILDVRMEGIWNIWGTGFGMR